MCPNPQFSANLVKFTEEILNGKLYFLYSDTKDCSIMYISNHYLEKLETHMCLSDIRLFCEVVGLHATAYFTETQQTCFARILTKVLFAALKDKKSSHDDNEGKPSFQTFAIELHKQAKISKQNKNT